MKIAIFTESYHPVINGVTLSIDTLVESLRRAGHSAVIYAPHAKDHQDTDPCVRRFPSYYFPGVPDYPLAIPFSRSLSREFAAEKFDLAHLQTPFAMGLSGLFLARRYGVPIVATMHTLYVEYCHYIPFVPNWLMRRITQGFLRWFYNRPAAVIVPGQSIERLARGYGIRRPIQVVPTGVEMPAPTERAEARRAFGLPGDAPVLLYVGRLAREKNIGLLIDAFRRVLEELPSSRLLLVGDGPARKECEALCMELGLSECVTFAGQRPHAEIPLAISAADLFLFPSATDTQALSVVEAMALSVPPIVVGAFGPADVVGDGVSGCIVPPNASAMAAAVISLLQDPERRQRLADGARRRAQDFSTEATFKVMLDVYKSVRQQQ